MHKIMGKTKLTRTEKLTMCPNFVPPVTPNCFVNTRKECISVWCNDLFIITPRQLVLSGKNLSVAIYIDKFWMLPLLSAQFPPFSCSFQKNFGQIICWRPLLFGWFPLGNSLIRQGLPLSIAYVLMELLDVCHFWQCPVWFCSDIDKQWIRKWFSFKSRKSTKWPCQPNNAFVC